jgi:hypothetical protein
VPELASTTVKSLTGASSTWASQSLDRLFKSFGICNIGTPGTTNELKA